MAGVLRERCLEQNAFEFASRVGMQVLLVGGERLLRTAPQRAAPFGASSGRAVD